MLKYARSNRGGIVVSDDRFGDEDQLMARLRVPLLKVKISESGVRLSDKVDIYLDPDRPFKKSWIPLGRLINRQARPN